MYLEHKLIVLDNEEPDGPRSERLVKLVGHGVHNNWQQVGSILSELTGNLASLSHLPND